MRRRQFLKAGAGVLAAGIPAWAAHAPPRAAPRVAVVGGGYAGATAAKYIRMLDPAVEVVLVEPNESFVSCPLSNLVIGGFRTMADITSAYETLASRHGVRLVRDRATAIDMSRRRVRLAHGDAIAFDRVIVAPGIDFMWEELPAMHDAEAQGTLLHAWKAGPQTAALRAQLEAMPDGGVFAISIPELPYRCPPAPYERACQAAAYFRTAKPRSKVLILDANGDVTSKAALFKQAWSELYAGMIEYRPDSKAVDVDVATRTVKLELEEVRGDVINVLPPMRAGRIAEPFVTVNRRWCEVDWLSYESTVAKGAHVVGDALFPAPVMPKSGHMANGHGKACAAAVVALLRDEAPDPAPTLTSTCYSFFSEQLAGHVASVHKYDTRERTMKPVPGAGGVSPSMNRQEARYALDWARNIWSDTLA